MVRGLVFDLDGVLVHTDELHYRAWKALAGRLGLPFTREQGDRCRGVSRMGSLEILLEGSTPSSSITWISKSSGVRSGLMLSVVKESKSCRIASGV